MSACNHTTAQSCLNADECAQCLREGKAESRSGFFDNTPLTRDWILSQGFVSVQADLGPEYRDHLEKGCLNVWEFNNTGRWLFNRYDSLEIRTRGQLRMLAYLLEVDMPDEKAKAATDELHLYPRQMAAKCPHCAGLLCQESKHHCGKPLIGEQPIPMPIVDDDVTVGMVYRDYRPKCPHCFRAITVILHTD